MSGKTLKFRVLAGLILIATAAVQGAPLSPADRTILQQEQQQRLDENQRQREELERSMVLPKPARPDSLSGQSGQ